MTLDYTITKWIRLDDIPTPLSYRELGTSAAGFWEDILGSKWVNANRTGVYQVSLTQPKDVVDKDIGYTGKSECIPKRLSDLRTSAGAGHKTAHHMCGVYLREENIKVSDVYVRCLSPLDKHSIEFMERWIHNEHKKRFGYKIGYAWEEASGGYKSCRIQTQMSIKRLESLEACEKVQKVLNEQIKKLKLLESEQ